ncbi:PucR family transcriptional regulator [Pseudonocardia acaciae]|uniref:PucR family transcriptional regulator n=1 Tax=Pseudonocardia acaciae TaxID=551276 RepID=UPI00048F5A0F|nr:PucR family transcriptional regulator [Pseudonocardia acaciae]
MRTGIISVADLVAMPRLRLTLLAGGAGTDRPVTWAHPSDLDHPWDWLTGAELVMRNGETLPAGGPEQLAYLRGLAGTGVAALVIGSDPRTHDLRAETLAAADELGFPVLSVPYSVGFAVVARAVADANFSGDSARLARTERIYQAVRDTLGGRTKRGLMSLLERELRCQLLLVDAEGAPVIADGGRRPSAPVADAITAAVAEAGGAIPGVLRIDAGPGPALLAVEVPAEETTLLVLVGAQPGWVDAPLLQHVATAAAVQIASWSLHRGYERRMGAELLSQLLDDQLDAGTADLRFGATGLPASECVLLAVRGARQAGERDLHLGLSRRSLPYLLLSTGEVLYVVLPDRPDALEFLRERVGPEASIGVSVALGGAHRFAAARREADWALSVAESSSGRLARYGDQMSLALLRDLDEARLVVDRTLGALLDYDRAHRTDLVGSLAAFLSCQRSWQRTARALGVHKQTVFYRIRRVEQLTGRSLAETADLAELWVAMRARALLDGRQER